MGMEATMMRLLNKTAACFLGLVPLLSGCAHPQLEINHVNIVSIGGWNVWWFVALFCLAVGMICASNDK